jgi:hypothetical protein
MSLKERERKGPRPWPLFILFFLNVINIYLLTIMRITHMKLFEVEKKKHTTQPLTHFLSFWLYLLHHIFIHNTTKTKKEYKKTTTKLNYIQIFSLFFYCAVCM